MEQAITRDPDVMHGTPVFRGTRVPVQTLFEYLEGGDTLENFLEGIPNREPRTRNSSPGRSEVLAPCAHLMRILLDECVDDRLRHFFHEHDCQTTRFAGFAGLKMELS